MGTKLSNIKDFNVQGEAVLPKEIELSRRVPNT